MNFGIERRGWARAGSTDVAHLRTQSGAPAATWDEGVPEANRGGAFSKWGLSAATPG